MANANKITGSEQKLFTTLVKARGTMTIQEVADSLGLTKNSVQVVMSNLRKKVTAAGRVFPEPKKLARGGGGNSEDINAFLEQFDEIV